MTVINKPYSNYPKGSEWRKWDLHIHTPKTYLNNQFNSCSIDDFVDKISQANLCAIGLTNYFKFDDIELGEIKTKLNDKGIVVFPNLEFRTQPQNKENQEMHIHVLFSDKVSVQKISNFLGRLKTVDDKYCKDLTETEIQTTSISIEILTKTLADDKDIKHFEDYLIVACPRGQGSFRPSSESDGRDNTLAIVIDKSSDILFGSTEDTTFFLNCDRFLNAKPKPVLSCSDAHKIDEIGLKFSWVKSDPTFEGLKQVIYEPEDRIKIQEEKPEEKKSYYIIDKVRYVDNTGENLFPSEDIELNPSLNAIIGGKSTGKSLLLYHIAKSIDSSEVVDKTILAQDSNYEDLEEKPGFGFEVVWKGGEINSLKLAQEGDARKILYIPQNYLTKLSDDCVKTRTALNNFVLDVVLQDTDLKKYYEDQTLKIHDLQKFSVEIVNGLFKLKDEILYRRQELKNMGDESGINKYIIELKQKIEDLKKSSGLTEAEVKEIQRINDLKTKSNQKLTSLKQDGQTLSTLHETIVQKIEEINLYAISETEYLTDPNLVTKLRQSIGQIEDYKIKLSLDIESYKTEITKEEKIHVENLKVWENTLTPLLNKVKLQDSLQQLIKKLKDEEEKIIKIESLKKQLEIKNKQFQDVAKQLLETNDKLFNSYQELQSNLKKGETALEDINLNVFIAFNEDMFNNNYINNFLNKKDLKKILNIKGDEEFVYRYDESSHSTNVGLIFRSIFNKQLTIIKNRSEIETIQKLFEDYYNVDFSISYNGDTLSKMSPGKRGYVLLKLLIHLSKEEYPILLDQPEGDLDNRSIYKELVQFIKEKKKQRQIIIVTHNPNLVVGADAEEVIVANQGGQDLEKERRLYQFEYVAGSLEHSFLEPTAKGVLFQKGIREHVCEILEGGEEAFRKREQKYNFKSSN